MSSRRDKKSWVGKISDADQRCRGRSIIAMMVVVWCLDGEVVVHTDLVAVVILYPLSSSLANRIPQRKQIMSCHVMSIQRFRLLSLTWPPLSSPPLDEHVKQYNLIMTPPSQPLCPQIHCVWRHGLRQKVSVKVVDKTSQNGAFSQSSLSPVFEGPEILGPFWMMAKAR